MRLIKAEGEDVVFEIGKREKRMFTDILKLYPVIPSSHHRLTRNLRNTRWESHQRLLEEALAEHRAENKRQLHAMLSEETRFRQAKGSWEFSLRRGQLEWLLQVLNDIRVGSWLILGEPDERHGKPAKLTADNSHFLFAMEACAYFQAVLLDAVGT